MGIRIGLECEDNEIFNNLVKESGEYGISIASTLTNNNIISNNIFMNNWVNAWEIEGANTNYFSLNGIGNYWDDHNCVDNLEPFGICDNPYIFTGNQDDFPLMEPHFSPTEVTATINTEDTEVEIVWSVPEFRDLESYNVYRFLSANSVNDTLWVTIAEEITDNIFTDTEWGFMEDGIYQYAVEAVYTYGFFSGTDLSNEVIKGSGVEAESNEINPLQTKLKNNYPNPFNPTTTIDFAIKEECFVEIDIYNIKGQKVKQLISKQLESGEHSLLWDGKDNNHKKVSSGIYFYNLAADGKKIETKKCIMLK